MSLSFRDHRFEPPKYSAEECKDKDMTYSAPMFVTAEFINNTTGEIKSQTVFMGDFPLMSAKGTFIINGTERVVVSQLVRSPGVYFDRQVDKTSDKDIYSCKVIPSRGAWLEFEIDKRARTRRCSTSTASCGPVSRRRASRPRRCWRTCTSTRSGTTWPRWAATRSTGSSASSCRSGRAR
jgi:DNA-directed RNA polymerase beta subunit